MKNHLIIVLILLLLPSIIAINLDVDKISTEETMISGLKAPVVFNLSITNLGQTDNFEFFNLLGFEMFPIGTTPITAGETKEIELKISPIGEFDQLGLYTFQYFIRGQDNTQLEEQLTFRIIELQDAFIIGSAEVDADSNSIKIFIENIVNFNFEDLNVKFSSVFFEFEETFDLEPKERKEFDVELSIEDFNKLTAGFYTLNAEISIEDETADIEGLIKFTEKNLITTTKKDSGFFVSTEIITKTNEGNTIEKSETIVEKNIISRLFTTLNPEPDVVDRIGTRVEYTWARELKPGESIEITTKTNWLFPVVVILLLIVTIILIKRYTKTNLVLRKKVSFVRTKGGEFALKVTILINAKRYIERVNIIDRLPALVKVHERFGGVEPVRIDEKTKRLEWNFEKLEPGEVRMLSYIIYSKVGVLGKFALPKATAIYDREGKIKETESNRAFFVSETKEAKVDEE